MLDPLRYAPRPERDSTTLSPLELAHHGRHPRGRHRAGAGGAAMSEQKWAGTKQRDDLKTCPFCDTIAVQQVRLAQSDTGMHFRIGCGNPFCLVEPNTPPYAALSDAEAAWQDRPASPPPNIADDEATYAVRDRHIRRS